MILINLLPEEYKNQIKKRKISEFTSSISILIVILAIAFIGGLFLITIVLKGQLVVKDKQLSDLNKKTESYSAEKQKLEEYNTSLSLAEKFSEKQVPWAETLSEIARSTPTEIQITDISVDLSKNATMSIKGNATNRRAIAKFAEKLEASDSFSKVKFIASDKNTQPGTNANEPAKTTCNFEITLNLDKLSKLVTSAAANQPASNQANNAAKNQAAE
jgi:Tfp pilus assembly protein PilN